MNKLKIKLKSGNGGNGKISFFRKNKKMIPNGGNGGNGGDIYIYINDKINNLNFFIKKKIFISQNGFSGKNNFKKGKNGKKIIIDIPKGTLVKNTQNNRIILNFYIKKKLFLILKGGKGGNGNSNFNFNNNKGDNGSFIELQLDHFIFSDLLLIGLPNSGKSSFINIVTNKKSFINYFSFSTLKPVLGVIKYKLKNNLYVLDLPGIINNSFNGLGLGLFFLKHLNFSKLFFHFIELKKNFFNSIKIINNEIYKYNKYFFYKPKIFLFNKFDLFFDNFNYFFFFKVLFFNNFFYYNVFISSKKKIIFMKIFDIIL